MDIAFIRRLKKESGADLNQCMQCGNCTVVCKLSPEENPFPSKEVLWAAWGLREKLLTDADIWLCHQCGDCSTYCPRGVRPADVLSSLRLQCIEHFSKAAFLNKWLVKAKYLPLSIGFPLLIIMLILYFAANFNIELNPVNYSAFFPHAWLNISFTAITFLSYTLFYFSLKTFYNKIKLHFPEREEKTAWRTSFLLALKEFAVHEKFGKCQQNRYRQIAHLLVVYGFTGLLAVTAFAIIAVLIEAYPMPFLHPVKIAGNIFGLAMIAGLVMMIIQRLKKDDAVAKTSFADWSFLISFLLLVLSGFMVEFARFANSVSGYYFYVFHLLCMWFVVIYLPFTKFAHIAYRFVAIMFMKRIGR